MVTDTPRPGDPHGDEVTVRYTVLSHKAITGWAVLIVVVGVGMAVWLLLAYGRGDPRVQLDAIRTAGTVVVGAGGAAALLLAARRQRATEIALRQKDRDQADVARAYTLQERVADITEKDAEARRFGDSYARAMEQLGSDKASVRLAGLYLLERLAQDNPRYRQTIVNVICGYLRMPYTPPEEPPAEDADEVPVATYTERIQEREVRLAAQRLLATHLEPGEGGVGDSVETFWPDIDLDLTSAVLLDFNLAKCVVRLAVFRRATFAGPSLFSEAMFTGAAWVSLAKFTGSAWFSQAKFTSTAYFDGATFVGSADFRDATFTGDALFDRAQFAKGVPEEVIRYVPAPTGADTSDERETA